MNDTYFDWFRCVLGRSDSFPALDAAQRAALDKIATTDAARPWIARAPVPEGASAPGSPTASPSEYLLDATVALTAFEAFSGQESMGAEFLAPGADAVPIGGEPSARAGAYDGALADSVYGGLDAGSFIGETGLGAEADAGVPEYAGDIHRVENVGSSMYLNEGGAFFDGDSGVSYIPGEGVSY